MIKCCCLQEFEKEELMHVTRFLHKMLSPVMHLKRLITLKHLVLAAISNKRISVTGLGRSLKSTTQERSNIRRSDRFVGNSKLSKERIEIYRLTSQLLVGTQKRPCIIVDWTSVPNTTHHTLRAALMAKGRALTLYEEVHPEKKLGNAQIQKKFLMTLKKILDKNCQPIIVTDAGFHNNWFTDVITQGWDYIGRVRGKKYYRKIGSKEWNNCKAILSSGSSKPKWIGEVELSRSKPLITHMYQIKKKLKGRKSLNRNGSKKRDHTSLEYSRASREAWILASSLSPGYFTAKKVVKIYSKRMQIEEGFRDLKSSEYGFGLEKARSKQIQRIEILLLIAMLASVLAWLTGYIGEKMNLQYQFQANSIKSKRVLSLFFLGCQIIRRKIKISIKNMLEALNEFNLNYKYYEV